MDRKPRRPRPTCCPPKLALRHRPLMTPAQAGALMDVFKILANDTRLRLLHALVRTDELCVNELAEAVGMKSQAVSNQLQRLSDRGIVGMRRDGTQIYYRIVDPCVTALLDRGLCLLEDAGTQRTESGKAAIGRGNLERHYGT
jgi:DNA-binding transcriptional ArsR family regulator